jgi:hypothetical protein
MLVRFSVGNFRSVLAKQTLDMRGVDAYAELKHQLINTEVSNYNEPLVKSMAVYGANASGKSNLVKALDVMKNMVEQSMNLGETASPLRKIVPFSFSSEARITATEFEVEVVINGQLFQYGFKATNERIEEEWLFVKSSNKLGARPAKWFHRIGSEFAPKSTQFKGNVSAWEKLTRVDTLFLSVAVAAGSEMLKPLYSWFAKLEIISDVQSHARSFSKIASSVIRERSLEEWSNSLPENVDGADLIPRLIEGAKTNKEKVLAFLQELDCGQDVVNIHIDKISDTLPTQGQDPLTQKRSNQTDLLKTYFIHKGLKENDPTFALPLEEESKGTQALYGFALWYQLMIDLGSVIVIDELDTSFHPLLMRALIQRFHYESKDAQMIFTTHDISVLSQNYLRRDQVLLVDKKEQQTELVPLSDYAVRKDESLDKGYLAGRYGAVPQIVKQFSWGKS